MTPQSNVFHGDCMEYMRQFPDGYFNLGVVDPPYGIKADKGIGRSGRKAVASGKIKGGDWDGAVPSDEYFEELFRVTKQQIIWGGNYFGMPAAKSFIIWDKGEKMYGRKFAECEYAWSSHDKPAKIFKLSPMQAGRIHPTQKPIALYEWLLRNYAKPGDKILDTHMGSQSSRIAAYKLGFDYWGSELDADYFRDGCARFEKEIAMPLFDAIQQPKQEKLFV